MGRSRRFDPERRSRIIDATLGLIAADGVAGVSHRKVAAHADVPLGSMTYHFANMDELLREAFERFTRSVAARFERRLAAAHGFTEAVEAVVDIIHVDVFATREDLVLTQEFYALTARRPDFRDVLDEWMHNSRNELQRHFDPVTARQIDALIEGLTMHRALSGHGYDRALTLDAVRRIAAGATDATNRTDGRG
ncbi:TetR/AcrR family transcriptional regulator [Saccharopolyspora montiporae]|nr:TetR family transcriptional regulator [Saccharopolyspora sp. HNM0983]